MFLRLLNDDGLGCRHAGREQRHGGEVAALDRQLLDLLTLEPLADDGVFRLQHGAGGGHFDPLFDRADFELEVDARGLAGRDLDFDSTVLKPLSALRTT